MKEYIITVVIVGICAFILENICISGKSKTLEKAMSLITSLCIFTCITLPALSLFNSCSKEKIDFPAKNSMNADNSSFYGLITDDQKTKISGIIFEKFGIEAECNSIQFNVIENVIEYVSIDIQLDKSEIHRKSEISEYLKSIFGQNTTINLTVADDEQNEDIS